jgi:hypothetical protein
MKACSPGQNHRHRNSCHKYRVNVNTEVQNGRSGERLNFYWSSPAQPFLASCLVEIHDQYFCSLLDIQGDSNLLSEFPEII